MNLGESLPFLAALVMLLLGLAIGKAWERYKLRDGGLHVEMSIYDLSAPRKSEAGGGQVSVESYRLKSLQHGLLRRQGNEEMRK